MVSTGLFGSYPLTAESINRHVRGISPGAYALGYVNQKGIFNVVRVGRSDDDLNTRLHKYVGDYKSFKYGFFNTAKEAFEKECRLYHDFEPPDNKIHPDRPDGTNYCCPVCGY
jgi:hypothetical protein